MWYIGPVVEAILKAKSQKALLLVFVKAKDEENTESKRMESFWNDESIMEVCQQAGIIALSLIEDSESAKQFAQIYPVVCIPTSFLILKGVPLEIIAGCKEEMTKEKLLEILNKAVTSHRKQTESEAGPSHTVTSVKDTVEKTVQETTPTVEGIKTVQETTPVKAEQVTPVQIEESVKPETTSAPLEDRVTRAKQLAKLRLEEKSKEDQLEEKLKELTRIKEGKESQKTEERQREMEIRETTNERKKQKQLDKEALKRVKDQIAADRAEKHERHMKEVAAEHTEKQTKIEEKRGTKKAEELAAIEARNKITKLLFRFVDGSSLAEDFDSDQTLGDVMAFIHEMYPRREFTQEDMERTLRQLELTPSATLIIMPESRRLVTKPASTGGWYDTIYDWVTAPFNYIYQLMASFIGIRTGPQPVTAPSGNSATDGETFGRRQGNIGRMPTGGGAQGASADDDNATWNGNSTQQL